MKFTLDLTTHKPIYVQVMGQVKHAVATGELQPNDQLPTVRQLADDLQVNFNTIARAYRLLDGEGIISTQHGRGTFILGAGSPAQSKRLREQRLALLAENFLIEAQKLGFTWREISDIVREKGKDSRT